MRVALITEGTYPVTTGGVSTWCDQLLRGLPEIDWTVVALTATGTEPAVWARPASVSSVVLHPVWGAEAPPARRRRRGADPRDAVADALVQLWDAALAPDGPDAVDRAEGALRALVESSTGGRLAALLASRGSTSALMAAWQRRCPDLPPLSIAQAVAASRLVDRTLAVVDAPLPEVDLVHAAGNGAAALVALAAHWRSGVPLLLSEHGVYLRERYLALEAGGFSWAERRATTSLLRRLCEVAYRTADRVLPVSDFNRRWSLHLGARPGSVTTIRNGVQPELYAPVGEEPAVPTLSFVGRIDPLKDLHTLVRAFALVRERVPGARLRLFGPVPEGNEAYRDSVAALSAELGTSDAVTFEGPSAGSRPAIAAGSVVVLSSISEGMPFTVIEAMMCGRATVSTDVGGVAECVDPERRAGMIVPARDPEAFAQACVELLTDEPRRRAMGAAARSHALAHATLDRTLAAYRRAYGSATRPALPVPAGPLNVVADVSALPPVPRATYAEARG
ncbi:Glycosyltransferase involved in cell wall bisynthesis [Blastococcus fimeti]|nr:Glycosyltransferase involved in cell wall bisynthesis [Blastococcus fimeti]